MCWYSLQGDSEKNISLKALAFHHQVSYIHQLLIPKSKENVLRVLYTISKFSLQWFYDTGEANVHAHVLMGQFCLYGSYLIEYWKVLKKLKRSDYEKRNKPESSLTQVIRHKLLNVMIIGKYQSSRYREDLPSCCWFLAHHTDFSPWSHCWSHSSM